MLRGVNFQIAPRAVTGLIGPNGSGKTTLLECVAGILDATSGEVLVGARSVPVSRRKDELFLMPESVRPWPEQQVAWALSYFRTVHAASEMRVAGLIGALALTSLLPSRMHQLSKGEHRRVLLAMALMTSHPVLLLDEPFDGLDLRQTRDVKALLRAEAAGGRSLLLSIHQLHDAGTVCDHLVLLSDGVVVGEGSLPELRARVGDDHASLDEVFLALT
ncbi:MAG: transporter related protein [Gemmatimonadetes bacterium]|nr:transporter related protein [Gemmatimonadota bacterium]